MEKSQRSLSVLTREERIRILRHIGIKPSPDDIYGRLPSVLKHLPDDWNQEDSILNMGGEAFLFPIIEQEALFVRKCYHDLYEIIKKAPISQSVRIMLTGTPGIGKSTFLVYFIIRYLYEYTIAPDSSKNPTVKFQ